MVYPGRSKNEQLYLEGVWLLSLTVVDQRSNDLRLRPFRLGVELFRQPVPSTLVCNTDFRQVVIQHGLVEVHDKLRGVIQWLMRSLHEGCQSTHAFDRIRDLCQSGLLSDLLLHRDQSSFVYPRLSYETYIAPSSDTTYGETSFIRLRTIVVEPILSVTANSKIQVDIVKVLVEVSLPECRALLGHDGVVYGLCALA